MLILGLTRLKLFNDEGPCHIETSPLICSANDRYGPIPMVGASVMEDFSTSLTFIMNHDNSCNFINLLTLFVIVTDSSKA